MFLLAPLIDSVSPVDFQTLKLENGLRLWEPLWAFGQPDVPCFTIAARHRRTVLRAHRSVTWFGASRRHRIDKYLDTLLLANQPISDGEATDRCRSLRRKMADCPS